jgi:CheY-like chemotaxis protein
MRVLIVEDSEPLAKLIAGYIQPIATNIMIAPDMATAMAELRKVPAFDIVTLDLNLPDSGVLDTLKRVVEIKQLNPDCLLVVITGMVSPEQEKLALDAGADGFMHKTLTVAEGKDTFLGTLKDIARSIARVPQRYQKNIPLAEGIADQICAYSEKMKTELNTQINDGQTC